jgi:hypothetical protein
MLITLANPSSRFCGKPVYEGYGCEHDGMKLLPEHT